VVWEESAAVGKFVPTIQDKKGPNRIHFCWAMIALPLSIGFVLRGDDRPGPSLAKKKPT
jgi:hypothetical protein